MLSGKTGRPVNSNDQLYKIVKESYGFIKKKKYKEAAFLLEKILKSSHTSHPYPNFLLAVSYILGDNFNEAVGYLKKMLQQFPEYAGFYALDAFISVKSSSTLEESLYKIISSNKLSSQNPRIDRVIKNLKNTKDFGKFQKRIKIKEFISIDKPPKDLIKNYKQEKSPGINYSRILRKRKKVFGFFILFIIISVSVISFIYFYSHMVKDNNKDPVSKSAIPKKGFDDSYLSLEENRYPVIDKIVKGKPIFFYSSAEELLKDFSIARQYAKQGKYNDAILIVNKISNSNANLRVRDKAEFLRSFILGIEEREASVYPVNEILKTPELYLGAKVTINGKTANIRTSNKKLEFDLLLNFNAKESFDGLVSVYSDSDGLKLSNGEIIKINAVLMNVLGSDKKLYFRMTEKIE